MRGRRAKVVLGSIGIGVALVVGTWLLGGYWSEPAVAIDRCPQWSCKDGCSGSGLEYPSDTGLTACYYQDVLVNCSGGETVHGHAAECVPSASCELYQQTGPFYCD